MIADAHEGFQNEKVNGNDRARVPMKKNVEVRRATGNDRDHVLADVAPNNSLHGPAAEGDPSTSTAPDFALETSTANAHGHAVLMPGLAAASGAASDQISPKSVL